MIAVRDEFTSLFMSGFFEEVQRRKVYRVAAAYIIAAGFIIQIGSAVFPAWELPNWAFRLVVVLLLIGFPITLILAWAYDVTPQGIRATTTPSVPIARRRRNVIMLIAIGVIISAAAGFFLLPRVSARKIDKSIAVLPFENLSDEKENAYFADGMQDDILTNLSKIGDLKVISRMSVMSYRGTGSRNAREIGKALGFSYYYGDRDYERALAEFEVAKRGLPNEAQAYMAIGAIQRRQGKWAESTANLEKAAELDPKNGSVLLNLAYSYMATRNFESADKTFDRGIEAAPESFGSRALKGELAIRWKGDVSVAEKELASVPPGIDPEGLVTLGRAGVLTLQRRFPEALQVIQQFRGETFIVRAGASCPTASLEGTLYLCLGDKVNARSAFERARIIAERLVRESPDDAARHGQLGLILAGLGQKDAAIAEGKRAVELLPESQDAFDGPDVTAVLAQIYAWTGESDEAFRLLDHLLVVPNGITVFYLKLDPVWDPLRKDPRFQVLIDKYSAKS